MSPPPGLDMVVSYHAQVHASGVSRFNEILATHLGLPHVALAEDAVLTASRPLLSFKCSELPSADARRLRGILARPGVTPDCYLHDWTGSELERELVARCERVWCGNLEVRAAVESLHPRCHDAYTPGLILDQRPFVPVELEVFSFGMAHKLHTAYYRRLRDLLERSGCTYSLQVSSARHATSNHDDDNVVFEEMRALFPTRLFFLGHLSDVAIYNYVREATFFASFFPGGVRANNTSVAAAMEQGAVVITNLDRYSPKEFVHGVNVLDIERLEEIPTERIRLRRIGVAAAETAAERSWASLAGQIASAAVQVDLSRL
jgi:hypothetical protein